MISFLYGDKLDQYPVLKHSMFRDRTEQFSTRLGWDVSVCPNGEERDQYDDLNPLYVVISHPSGTHAGSMRFLPTTGRTMVNDHFSDLTDGVHIQSPYIWECTRFCISPRAGRRTAPALLAAGGKLMQECLLEHLIGVFDQRMERIYRLMGATPTILGRGINGTGKIGVGLWRYDRETYLKMLNRAKTSMAYMDDAYSLSICSDPQLANTG